jgi:hypothetical protein
MQGANQGSVIIVPGPILKVAIEGMFGATWG